MKNRTQNLFVALAMLALLTLNSQLSTAFAQGTAFTYQGQLQNNGSPASGTYNLVFSLYTNNTSGVAIAGPVTNSAVNVTNGLFTAMIDFGPGVFTGGTNWLQIGVATNGVSSFTPLTPRQQLTPTPYAIYAENASAAGISGTIPPASLGGTYGNQIILNNANNSVSGTFTGNGAGLSGVNAALLNGLAASNFWQTAGNAHTSPTNGNFLGTTDNQPLELRVNGQRALRLEPTATYGSINIIGGLENFVMPGAVGSVIGGGGRLDNGGVAETNSIAANYAFIGGGSGNTINAGADYSAVVSGSGSIMDVSSDHSVIAGGDQNWIGEYTDHSVIGGGSGNTMLIPGGGTANIIAGGEGNNFGAAEASGISDSVISGGNGNQILGYSDTIGGGTENFATNNYGTVGGGFGNVASGISATVAGGGQEYSPTIKGVEPAVGGGGGNAASGDYSFIGGGWGNNASDTDTTIGGGDNNQASGPASVISGGEYNSTGEDHATVAGGSGNYAGGSYGFVGGGQNNNAGGAGDVLAGGYNNSSGGGNNSTISGGNYNNSSGSDAVIGGGQQNSVSAWFTTVGGGVNNMATDDAAVVAGGTNNVSGGFAASVGGGQNNSALGNWSTVGGGWFNQANGDSATVGGGYNNSAVDSATVAGGRDNVASDYSTTVSGGLDNQSVVYGSAVGGGRDNNAEGYAATIPGGASNVVSGSYSFAAGFQAQATNDNSFVWSDGSGSTATTTANQFIARASGGFVLFSDAAGTGVSLAPGSGSWSTMSDRNAKDDFAPVNSQAVLAQVASLPMTTWSYKTEPGVRHVGPMAQDFHAAFAVGEDDRHITEVDEGGVALAAIQGLNEKLNEKDAEIQDLKARLEKLEQLINSRNGGGQ